MPLLGAAIMDTERMIPNSRSSQNGSSPGSSGQSSAGNPTYHNATTTSSSNLVARKKKTERLVPPLVPNHGGLVNGNDNSLLRNSTSNGYMNSTGIYSPMGISNAGFSRENIR